MRDDRYPHCFIVKAIFVRRLDALGNQLERAAPWNEEEVLEPIRNADLGVEP